jgi:uncharacterized protein (TIGR03000 family)
MHSQPIVRPASSAFLAALSPASPIRRLARACVFAGLAALAALTGLGTASAQNYGGYGPAPTSPAVITLHHYYVPPAQAAAEETATLEVRLPESAELRFNGAATRQTGGQRVFTTPSLRAGQRYEYDVAARWFQDGREVRLARRITVRAGERLVVDFIDLARARRGMAVREFPAPRPAGDGLTRPAGFERSAADYMRPAARRIPGRMSIVEFE